MGARPTSNNFMIDGTSNTDTALGTPAVDPLRGRPGGVQGADQDLLGGVRLQRQPDQPRQQVRHERVPRRLVLLRPERGARRQELLRLADRGRSPRWTRSSSGGRSAVRSSRTRPSCSSTTRVRGSSSGSSTFYIVPTPGPAGRPLLDHDHRSPSPGSPSRTTPSLSRASRASRSWRCGTSGTPPRTSTCLRATTRRSGRFPRPRTSSRSGSTRTWAGSEGRSPATRRRRTRTRPAGR